MANIFGTILSVGDFLKIETAYLKTTGGETEQIFNLSAGRKYIIPDYQREIRWSEENLMELIIDISRGDKFLGNIILNKHTALEYEVIDGQQRITVLLMIVYYIKSKYKDEIDIFEACNLKMANFDRFDLFIDNNCNIEDCDPTVKIQIERSDVFNQRKRYQDLWKVFETISMLQTPASCDVFLANLKRSQFNIIVNTNDTGNYSIDYFLDVNLKGVKLDVEDIFKGYLFSQDSSQAIRSEWNAFKINAFEFNKIADYSITKLLEHYFYCDLYKKDIYRNIQFNEEFKISEITLNGVKQFDGEHLIKVIHNKTYMINSLKNINIFLTVILDVIKGAGPSHDFKKLFNPAAMIDTDEITIIYNFIKKIMMDKNVVPKILIMKYVIEVLFEKTNRMKEDYTKIYGVYLLAVLFTVFENDKSIKKVLGVVKDREWYSKSIVQSKSYFTHSKITKSKITAQYKIINESDIENHMFRCKSLATIFNYFIISDNAVNIVNGKTADLKNFISDSKNFSNEHLIINDSGTYSLENNEINNKYPTDIKKYANSIFNFIFVSTQINSDLGNYPLHKKIRMLDEKRILIPSCIECDFSKMIIDSCRETFSGLINLSATNPEEEKREINRFYEEKFIIVFSDYAAEVIKKIGDKLGAV